MQEIWKFYKETYGPRWGHLIWTVSNYGRVKRNGELYICPICGGYYYLCRRPLHRIVAELFIPGWDEKFEVDHKDCNKLNNMVTNLLICQKHKQNMNNPLSIQHMREGHFKKSVLQYTLNNEFVAEYVSIKEAFKQTKIYSGNIVKCCKNKLKSTGGYIWRYKKED
jgi:hypothetical protein